MDPHPIAVSNPDPCYGSRENNREKWLQVLGTASSGGGVHHVTFAGC
jgi:hypothetical protein